MRRLNDKANNMTQTPPKSMAALICLAVFAVLAARFDQRWIDMSYLPSLAAGNTSWVAKIQEGYGGVVLANSTTWLGPTANTTFSMLNFLGGNRNESESVTVSTASTMSSLEEQTSANLTLVVQVAGELGNHLGYVNRGIMLARMAQELAVEQNLDLHTNILLKQQGRGEGKHFRLLVKAADTEKTLRKCFPWFRNISFGFGHSPEYDRLKEMQSNMPAWNFLKQDDNITKGLKSTTTWKMRQAMHLVVESIRNATLIARSIGDNNENMMTSTKSLSDMIPMMDVSGMATFSFPFEEELRDVFRLDHHQCCKIHADPDETVFHYRNFLEEMPKRGKNLGFEELSGSKIAHELFRDLKPGDKVAILTRFQNSKVVAEIKDLLQQVQGAQVRIVANNSGVEDFCLLQTAQKEVVGSMLSTFVRWGSFLGRAEKVRLYFLDSPNFRKRGADDMFSEAINLLSSSPSSPRRIQFEVYRSEEMDQILNETGKGGPDSDDYERNLNRLMDEISKARANQ